MNLLVALFYIHNVLATAFLGGKFFTRKDPVLKNFGTALLLNSVAFAIWSFAVITRPDNLAFYVTLGVSFFITALVFLLNTATQNLKSDMQTKIMVVGVVFGLLFFYLRTYVYPATPSFSEEGFFFFNVHPIIQMCYIFGLLITTLPALNLVTSKFKSIFAPLIWFCFLIEIIGGIVLITTTDSQALYVSGLVMGTAYAILWLPLLLSKKAWTAIK